MEISNLNHFTLVVLRRFFVKQTLNLGHHVSLDNKEFDYAFDFDSSLIHLFAPQNHYNDIFTSRLIIVVNNVLDGYIT